MHGDMQLHWACHFGHCDIVNTLVLAGDEETIIDLEKLTSAQEAMKEGRGEVVKMLDSGCLWAISIVHSN